MRLSGCITALATPFTATGTLDLNAWRDLLRQQLDAGVNAIVVAGSTGEAPALFDDEFDALVRSAVAFSAGRIPVLVGTGQANTAKTVQANRRVAALGADAALVVTPYYNRPSQEGLYAHYAAINEAVQLPVLVYNVPGRTSVDISNETLGRLSKLPNIVGIKDATADMTRATVQRQLCGEDWVLLSGDDLTALGYMAHGGHGCISVTANIAPDLCATFYNAAMGGDWQTALYWQDRLFRLHRSLFTDASPAPTKFALSHLGLCAEDARLPIVPASEASRAEVLAGMREAGVI